MLANKVALIALILLSACAPQPTASPSSQPPSGTWSGDYALEADRREPIGVDLRWEGENLRGAVRSGPRSLPLTKATFKPETGAISMEFDAEGNGGRTVHYVIDGKVSGDMMTGTWTHDDQHGDFRVTRQ
jgi:hypothetical protein